MGIIKKFRKLATPYRYIFTDPDTGREFAAGSRASLVRQIVNYREQNRLDPIEALDSVLECYWCSLRENAGSCEDIQLRRGWVQYLKGGVALLENIFYGEENMVSREEANARAKICEGCPHNVFPNKDHFVKWSDEIALAATGGRYTEVDTALGSCEICSCPLRAKVWVKPPFKLSSGEQTQLPGFCWQKEEG